MNDSKNSSGIELTQPRSLDDVANQYDINDKNKIVLQELKNAHITHYLKQSSYLELAYKGLWSLCSIGTIITLAVLVAGFKTDLDNTKNQVSTLQARVDLLTATITNTISQVNNLGATISLASQVSDNKILQITNSANQTLQLVNQQSMLLNKSISSSLNNLISQVDQRFQNIKTSTDSFILLITNQVGFINSSVIKTTNSLKLKADQSSLTQLTVNFSSIILNIASLNNSLRVINSNVNNILTPSVNQLKYSNSSIYNKLSQLSQQNPFSYDSVGTISTTGVIISANDRMILNPLFPCMITSTCTTGLGNIVNCAKVICSKILLMLYCNSQGNPCSSSQSCTSNLIVFSSTGSRYYTLSTHLATTPIVDTGFPTTVYLQLNDKIAIVNSGTEYNGNYGCDYIEYK